VTRSPLTFRAFVSTLLLVLQVLGLGHVALARHTVSESGALVDVQPLLIDSHDETESHVCAHEVEIHADAPGDCLVVATWTSPLLLTPSLPLHHVLDVAAGPALAAVTAEPPLDLLAVAPKASPPRA
jgi:hypothetical protein